MLHRLRMDAQHKGIYLLLQPGPFAEVVGEKESIRKALPCWRRKRANAKTTYLNFIKSRRESQMIANNFHAFEVYMQVCRCLGLAPGAQDFTDFCRSGYNLLTIWHPGACA